MPYFVRWTVPVGQDDIVEQPQPYKELMDAMDFACAVLLRNPIDIWVEDEKGNLKAMDFRIRLHCQSRGLI